MLVVAGRVLLALLVVLVAHGPVKNPDSVLSVLYFGCLFLIVIKLIWVNKFRHRATPRVCPFSASLLLLSTTALFPALSCAVTENAQSGGQGVYTSDNIS